jgi:Ca2+-binding RTX toxin-like protein
MARHVIYGSGPTIFASNSAGSPHRPLYLVPTEFGILNNDGTHTYFTGTGFSYDWLNGVFTGGTVTSIVHYDIYGQPLDQMTALSVPATSLEAVFFSIAEYGSNAGPMPLNLLSGSDYIDARVRAGGAEVADYIYAGDGNDVVLGGSGNDVLWGGNGNDRLFGDDGADTLLGEAGDDRLYGGASYDTLEGGEGNDVLFGEDGADTLYGSQGDDQLYGGAGDDSIIDQLGSNIVRGGDGNDRIGVGVRTTAEVGNSQIYGDAGNDYISGGAGADYIRGGADDDSVTAGEGDDTVYGDTGNDTLSGQNGADRIWGGVGADTLNGNAGADYILGETDADTLNGGSGNDRLLGGAGADKLIGDDLNIVLNGTGRDVLFGGEGDDVLWGRGDTDSLNGDAGIDTAVYTLSAFADLKIVQNATGFYVYSRFEGLDSLANVERIATTDGIFAWNSEASRWDKVSTQTAASLVGLFTAPVVASGTADDDTVSWNNLPGGPQTGFAPSVFLALDGDDSIRFSGFTTSRGNPFYEGYGEAAVFGGNGNDVIKVDVLDIGTYDFRDVSGIFYFDGGAGNDTLTGGNSDDVLIGSSGDDILRGNKGDDTMSGGAGADTFEFTRFTFSSGMITHSGWGADVISDFVVGVDHLHYSDVISSTVVDTAAGLLVTSTLYSVDLGQYGGPAGEPIPTTSASVLLQGLHGSFAIGDLVI